MSQPLITILIRTSNRPELFARCLESVRQQTYKSYNIIVGYDNTVALHYIPAELQRIPMPVDYSYPYHYDLYCNYLKEMVTNGWFFFLDDDDILATPTVLEELAAYLTEPGAIVCQMLRNGFAKPRDNYIKHHVIREGKIGLPCLVLHSDYRHIGQLDGQKGGDYRYIKEVITQVPTKYICLPLVDAGTRSHGQDQSKCTNFQNIQK